MNLKDVLDQYGVPDPSIVGKLPRGGITLDFVGHAEITKILLEIDPNWSWEPVAWTADGRPAINVVNGNAVMWGRLTVLGQTRLGVGTAKHDKQDLDKELIGDFLRNAAMRFGICLSLWSKSEWEEQPQSAPAPKPAAKADPKNIQGAPLAVSKVRFVDACKKEGINPHTFAKEHGVVDLDAATADDYAKLRKAYHAHLNSKAPAEKDSVNANTLTVLAMKKKFSKEDRLEMASDVAKRPVKDLNDLNEQQMLELKEILEAASVQE